MSIRIFISHRETDHKSASALVEYLISVLDIKRDDIRCTSSIGTRIPLAAEINNQLRDDIKTSDVFIALITKDSLRSQWVVMELGAAWILNKPILQIVHSQLSVDKLPGPLKSYESIIMGSTDPVGRIQDAVDEMSKVLGVSCRVGSAPHQRLCEFVDMFSSCSTEDEQSHTVRQAQSFVLGCYIITLSSPSFHHNPLAAIEIVKEYISDLQITLPSEFNDLRPAIEGDNSMIINAIKDRIAGQLQSKQPDIVEYFVAGCNITIAISRGDYGSCSATIKNP